MSGGGCPVVISHHRHEGGSITTAALALPGNTAAAVLTHFFGPGLADDVHPNVSGVYRHKVARLAEAFGKPEERDAAAATIRELIDGIVLTPGEKRGEFGNILEWTGSGAENEKTDTALSGKSVSVIAGPGFKPATCRL